MSGTHQTKSTKLFHYHVGVNIFMRFHIYKFQRKTSMFSRKTKGSQQTNATGHKILYIILQVNIL